MIPAGNVMSDVYTTYVAADNSKKIKITATSLADNVLILGYNRVEGQSLTSASQNKWMKFDASAGELALGAFLKIASSNAATGQFLVGPQTSNNVGELQNAAATLSVLAADTVPSGASLPTSNMPNAMTFWTAYLDRTPDFYLDLKTLTNGKRYCQVKVDALNANTGLLEGNVFIYIILPGPVTYVIYADESGQSSSSANGEPFDIIQNRNIYLDLQGVSEAYMFAMIGKKGNNPWTFEVGDPKTDAGVGASEV